MKTSKKSESVKKFEKQIKEMKKPVYVDKLELGSGEVYVGNLSDADKFQVLVRHLNILEQNVSMLTQCCTIQAICLEELCKKQGIDIHKIINK